MAIHWPSAAGNSQQAHDVWWRASMTTNASFLPQSTTPRWHDDVLWRYTRTSVSVCINTRVCVKIVCVCGQCNTIVGLTQTSFLYSSGCVAYFSLLCKSSDVLGYGALVQHLVDQVGRGRDAVNLLPAWQELWRAVLVLDYNHDRNVISNFNMFVSLFLLVACYKMTVSGR